MTQISADGLTLIFSTYFGTRGADTADTIAVDDLGNVYIAGTRSNEVYVAKIGDPNQPPTAKAGPDQSIRAGDTVFLDGTASFDDNTATVDLLFDWVLALPPASGAALDDATIATPSFVADIAGTYLVGLVVTDADGVASEVDAVSVSSDNLAPTAVAGDDQLVIVGATVLLDGIGSTDPETDPLTFAWTLPAVPAGSAATLGGAATVTPTFVPDLEGLYVVQLEVSDFIGPGEPDTVQVTATTVAGFAEFHIVAACDTVTNLDASQVSTEGNRRALCNFLGQAIRALQKGQLATALDKLDKSIKRTDGCALRGAPDGNGPGRDWITDCSAQATVYNALVLALGALTP